MEVDEESTRKVDEESTRKVDEDSTRKVEDSTRKVDEESTRKVNEESTRKVDEEITRKRKLANIIEHEFDQFIARKQRALTEIDARLLQVRQLLQLVRYLQHTGGRIKRVN